MRVERSLLESVPGASKFISILERMSMKLPSKLGGLTAESCWIWLSLAGRLTVLTLLVVGLELRSFSYHPALFLVAGPVFFLFLPYFSQSELCGGVVIWSVHQCGPISLTDVGSVSLPT
eukprot:1136223-Pelagomonas_calceolata.AAC.1